MSQNMGERAPERLTRAQKREFIKQLGLDRPLQATKSVVNARARAQKWRDRRHDAGLPDNRFLGSLLLPIILDIDAQRRCAGSQGLDKVFATLLDRLPPRYDRAAVETLLKCMRDTALYSECDRQIAEDLRVRHMSYD